MKIQYRPCKLDAGNTAGFNILPLVCGTYMDVPVGTVYPANVTEFRNSLDAKVVPVDRSFTRFYRVARYAKRHGVFDREILTAL